MSAVRHQAVIQDRADRTGQSAPNGSGRDIEGIAERAAVSANAQDVLARAVRDEVVPRLLLARGGQASPDLRTPFTAGEVTTLAELALARDTTVALSFIDTIRSRGLPLETLYLQLLAPAARHLGELWVEDLCDFSAVTIGLGRLQGLMRELSPVFLGERASRAVGRRALLMAAPGETHTFGLSMVAEFFRRAGWLVRCSPKFTTAELVASLKRDTFDVVGISLGGETHLDDVATTIRTIRRISRNQGIGVLVGGPFFVEHPGIAPLVGADATAIDGRHAVTQAENLLAMLSRPV